MLDGEKILTENSCCLCLNDEESTFSANTVMKSMPLHEMVDSCIGVQVNKLPPASIECDERYFQRQFWFSNFLQLTDAQSYHTLFNLSIICNECVLNVNNFYAFKQKILTAQKALADCADLGGDPLGLDQLGMYSTRADVENHESNEDAAINDGVKIDQTDDDVEFLILQQPDASDAIYNRTQSTTQTPQKSTPTAAVVAKRRNPSKRKRVDDLSADAEKVAIQVNECLICPAVLSDILELNEHAAAHTSIVCKVQSCNRSFLRYSNLKRHFATAHSKPKPFICDLCGLGFSFSVNLQTHAALHYSGKIQVKNNKWNLVVARKYH